MTNKKLNAEEKAPLADFEKGKLSSVTNASLAIGKARRTTSTHLKKNTHQRLDI